MLLKKKHEDFYVLGQEINVSKSASFKKLTCGNDSLSMTKNRVVFASIMFILIYGVLCVRLFDVCIVPNLHKHKEVAIHDEDIRFDKSPIKRADIIDRNGTIIATSLPTVNVYANPKKILNASDAAIKLSNVLPDMMYEDILAKLTKKATFVYIKRNLSPSQQYQINALGIPGLEFENGEKRVYPHKGLFAHMIGTTNIDNEGISGIEKELDERLTQSDIPLKLTIDAGVQDTIREHLAAAITKYDAMGATAILMDVNTAEIIASVSLPDFDPNQNMRINERAQFNFATKGVYEPGSVLKIFNTAMALESGKVKVPDKFDATKPLKLRYNTIKDYRGENRWLSVQEVLIHSSNIGSAQMALKVGKPTQMAFIKSIGFMDSLDIEITEKAKPIVPKRWGEETVATVAYGYGISVTPMHIITAFSGVVNGGIYRAPKILQDGSVKEEHRIVSEATSKSMRSLLRGVVVEGSGKRANVLGYEVAGKTGTANKLDERGRYVDKKVMTTFISTFPASEPKYALYVMMDEPKASKETFGFATSGWNTVPTAGKIIEEIAPQLNVQANYDVDELRRNKIIEASYRR